MIYRAVFFSNSDIGDEAAYMMSTTCLNQIFDSNSLSWVKLERLLKCWDDVRVYLGDTAEFEKMK
jgi:hypothetical protein